MTVRQVALRACAALSLSGLVGAGVLSMDAAPAFGAAAAVGATAGIDRYGELVNPALQTRFEDITHKLRCLVCQNESIADSNADLAGDLRREVREMLLAGRSDAAIFEFMTDRYGEFVRFNPSLTPKTLLIWGAPFVVLLLGGVIVFKVTRQRARMPLDDDPASDPY